jgi:hypothetical protein
MVRVYPREQIRKTQQNGLPLPLTKQSYKGSPMTIPSPQPSNASMSRSEILTRLAKGLVLAILASALTLALVPASQAAGLLQLHVTLLVLATLAGLAFAYSTPQQRADLHTWRTAAYAALTVQQALYLRVCVVTAFTLFMTKAMPPAEVRIILYASLAFVGYVALWDCLRLYRRVSDSLLGKAAIAVGFAVASTYAYALASQQVAAVIHATPTGFSHTNLIVAIMMIPLIISLTGAFVAAVGTSLSWLVLLPTLLPGFDKLGKWLFAGTWPQSTLRFAFATRLFQSVFYTTIGFSLVALGRHNSAPYEQFVARQIPTLVYELDMYAGAECRLAPGAKLASLGDAKFLVATKSDEGGITFDPPVKCDD